MCILCLPASCFYLLLSIAGVTTPSFFFFFNDTATTEIYTLSLHDALPISGPRIVSLKTVPEGATLQYAGAAQQFLAIATYDDGMERDVTGEAEWRVSNPGLARRSEEHTSELQSPDHLVCRLLLEKKKHIQRLRMRETCSIQKGRGGRTKVGRLCSRETCGTCDAQAPHPWAPNHCEDVRKCIHSSA